MNLSRPRTVDALPPPPSDMTHILNCGAGDEGNRNHAWMANCPLCMYRYGFNNGATTARSTGTIYPDGSRLSIDEHGHVILEAA